MFNNRQLRKMFFKELLKFSSQNRTLYCYFCLSVWIFLLIFGMYKYIGTTENGNFLNSKNFYTQQSKQSKEEEQQRRYKQDCNLPETIQQMDEAGIIEGWKLQGVLLLIRHGDRGPMSHVRGIAGVNCGVENNQLVNKYRSFLLNATSSTVGPGHATWQRTGHFHGFPLLPATMSKCLLGQLTYLGISQMLRIGEVLRNAYANPLQLYYYPPPYQSAASRQNATLAYQTENIVMYSTKYRRTFQSAMALFFTLLPKELWSGLQVHESHSLSFCFADCACQRAEILKSRLEKNASKALDQHVTVQSIVTWVGSSLLQNPAHSQLMPLEIRDAALSLICHNAQLPCRRAAGEAPDPDKPENKATTTVKSVENSDFINIDQDYNSNANNNKQPAQVLVAAAAEAPTLTEDENDSSNEVEPEPEGCVDQSHIMALMQYNNWQAAREMRSHDMRTQGLLRAYGLLRHIVNYMLKIISGEKIKLVLYSGHDKTMQSVQAALGLHQLLQDNPFVPYGSRLVFEVYRSVNKDIEYYFRLLYNGVDVTNQIHICEAGKSLRVNRGRKQKADLCPIENIIRFIHDDYFNSLNVTNFRDACMPPTTTKVDDFL